MTNAPSTSHVSFRIRTDLADKIRPLAQSRGVSESRLIEELITEGVRGTSLEQSDPNDPNAALDLLLEHVRLMLEPRRGAGVLNRHAILEVFNGIKISPALMAIRDAAIVPPPASGLTPEGRKQFVHQRVARFTKTFLGMQSGREMTLPKTSEALIRSYTELL